MGTKNINIINIIDFYPIVLIQHLKYTGYFNFGEKTCIYNS